MTYLLPSTFATRSTTLNQYLYKDSILRNLKEKSTEKKDNIFYLRVASDLNYIEHGVLFPVFYASRKVLQLSASVTVTDLTFANKFLSTKQSLYPTITYISKSSPVHHTFLTFLGANLVRAVYGQTGCISGLYDQSSNSVYAFYSISQH